MRRTCLLLLLMPVFVLAGAHRSAAQKVAHASVTVSANVVGHFGCTVSTESFDFGDLDAGGINVGNPYVASKGRSSINAGEIYETAAGSIMWTCRATPAGTVNIALASTPADHTGGMYVDDLEVRIPTVGDGVSTGYQAFSSGADLLTGVSLGAGANALSGPMDLRLTVLDDDPVGVNTWVIRLRATANP